VIMTMIFVTKSGYATSAMSALGYGAVLWLCLYWVYDLTNL